jgi:hypothetical protein
MKKTTETLVCIVVLMVLPHLIRYFLPQIDHESMLTSLACLKLTMKTCSLAWPDDEVA